MLKEEFTKKFQERSPCMNSVDDYDIIKAIGNGAYGEVFLVRNKSTFTYHAMKAVAKEVVVARKHVKHLILEKKILECVHFPFTLTIDVAFKDNVYLYFILPFVAGGEMFNYIQKYGSFSDELSKFYAGQVVLALEYIHHCEVIHRDIKPENILIDVTGYVKLCDFGFSKKIKKKTWTLCGTPEYLAPEIIMSRGYNYAVDWWAVGVLIYEMEAGTPPFYSGDPAKLYDNIIEGRYKFPENMNGECRNLIKGFLQVDPSKRIGSLIGGVYDIKSHSWFKEIDWDALLHQRIEPPFIPVCASSGDTSNFPEMSQPMLQRCSKCLYEAEFNDF